MQYRTGTRIPTRIVVYQAETPSPVDVPIVKTESPVVVSANVAVGMLVCQGHRRTGTKQESLGKDPVVCIASRYAHIIILDAVEHEPAVYLDRGRLAILRHNILQLGVVELNAVACITDAGEPRAATYLLARALCKRRRI